jgi:hypothetical protein
MAERHLKRFNLRWRPFASLTSLVIALCVAAHAQIVSTPTVRQTPPIALVPNGTANAGNVVVDFRGLAVLAMTPKSVVFSQPGQTQQLTVQAVLTDRSSFTK